MEGEITKEGNKIDERNLLIDEIHFAVVCGYRPFPYQVNFLLDNSKRIIFVAGRQVGKSTMASIKALYNALKHDNWTILVVAPTFRQSKIIFDKMREIVITRPWITMRTERITQTMIYFKNRSRIFCLPSGYTGETIRGFTSQLIIIDEGAYVPEEVYVSVVPALSTTDGSLWLLGTPAGKRGYFWSAWNSPEFSKHHAKTEENPLVTKEFLEEQRMAMTEIQFRQEFLGEFVEEADVFYNYELVKKVAVGDWKEKPEEDRERFKYYLGVDLARMGNDESAYVIVEYDEKEDRLRMANYQTTSKKPLTDAIGRIKALDNFWRFERIIIDESGLGSGVVDSLKEEIGFKVRGFTFSSKEREELYTNLKYLMEKGKLTILNDIKLRNQLTSLTYEYTSSGRLKIKKPERGNDDLVDALALAVWEFRRKSVVKELEIQPLEPPSFRGFEQYFSGW